jgi:hypothetical protein
MYRKLGWLPLAAVIVVGATACDSESTGPSGTDFDPQSTEETVQSLQAELNADGDILASLALAGSTLAAQGAVSIVLPRHLEEPATPFAAQMVQGYALSGAAEPAFPVELYGTVFEWSVDLGTYVLSSLTGAPDQTVRFIMYAINPITGQPVAPLVEIGYVDITDIGTDLTTGVRVYAAADEVTDPWVDYAIEASYTVEGENLAVEVTADGFISDGTETLRFDLSETAALLAASETISVDVLYALWLDGQPARVSVDLHTVLDFSSEVVVEAATVGVIITSGTDTVELDMTLATDNTLSGVIDYNHAPAIYITGTEGDPVFQRVDDQPLTADDIAALLQMYDLLGDVLDLAESLFQPLNGASI